MEFLINLVEWKHDPEAGIGLKQQIYENLSKPFARIILSVQKWGSFAISFGGK